MREREALIAQRLDKNATYGQFAINYNESIKVSEFLIGLRRAKKLTVHERILIYSADADAERTS